MNVLPTCPFSSRESTLTPIPLTHILLLVNLSNTSALGLIGTNRAYLSSTSYRSCNFSKCSNYPWCPVPIITKALCNVDSCSQRRSPVTGIQDSCILIPLLLHCSPSCFWARLWKGLGSQSVMALPLYSSLYE